MSDSTKPLLDLDALAPRDYVMLGGKRYLLAHVDGFGLRDRARLFALAEEVGALEAKGRSATEADIGLYEEKVRELTGLILPTAPPKQLAKVPFGRLVALCTAFFVWMQTVSLLPRALIQMSSASSSPGSTASTRRSPSTRRGRSSRRSP